jgi:uncharacterized membrane protein YhfC
MVTIVYGIAIIFMVLLPLIFSFSLVRKYGTAWMIFMMGGLAFLVAEIVRAPVTNWIVGTDFFNNATKGSEIVYVVMFYALLISLFQNAARYAGFRLAGSPSKTWGGGITVAAGFAAMNVVLIFGFNAIGTLVYVLTFPSAAPDGVTAAEFAAMQQQVADFWNATFLNAFVQTQIIPGLWQFSLQFALSMIMWVGLTQKKWQWIASGFIFQVAMVSVYSVVGNWILMYLANAQDYLINLVVGSLIFLVMMAFNAGIVYFIYKKIKPLTPEVVEVKAKPAPAKPTSAKPAQNTLAPREKSVQDVKPSKKIKNTDLK